MTARSWENWGPLADRYRGTRPRRLLALDGGGIRGLLTLQVLAKLEEALRDRMNAGPQFRLSDFFDLIAGTSTGAIIAAGLSRGMSTAELLTFYREFGREAFTKRALITRWKSLYANGPLQQKLQDTFGRATTLEPEHLKTLLLVVTRNATTDSAWPISSNPWAKYNDRSRADCNLLLPLWQIVRASTAAPLYFQPEVITLGKEKSARPFVFVDGGTTAYNDPAFLMYRMATEPAYHLGWLRGEGNLLIVSVGTGSAPVLGQTDEHPEQNLALAAKQTLLALMSQAAFDQDLSCRTVGRCVTGPVLDREVGDLVPRDAAGERIPLSVDLDRSFLYARYDADLTPEGLRALGCEDLDPQAVATLDSVDHMDDLERVGEAVAKQLSVDDYGPFVVP